MNCWKAGQEIFSLPYMEGDAWPDEIETTIAKINKNYQLEAQAQIKQLLSNELKILLKKHAKCTKCDDFDLCTDCYSKQQTPHEHPLTRINENEQKQQSVILPSVSSPDLLLAPTTEVENGSTIP
ncbi:unnamed protein product, partial [Didymodactylos carnosus]